MSEDNIATPTEPNNSGDVITIDAEDWKAFQQDRIQSGESSYSRKVLLEAGKTNFYIAPSGDTEYATFEQARIIQISARVGDIRSGRGISVNYNIVFDGFEAGLVQDDELVPHAFFTESRYEQFRDVNAPVPLIPRLAGSGWVLQPNIDKFLNFYSALHNRGQFTSLENPPNHPDSQRTTRDRLRLIPHDARAERMADPNYGYPLTAFELTVNPSYDRAHRSFVEGLDNQVERINAIARMPAGSDQRRKALVLLLRNVNFVSGTRYAKGPEREMPRQADIGMFQLGSDEFLLYSPGGNQVNPELFDDVVMSGKAIAEREEGTPSGAADPESLKAALADADLDL